MQNDAKLGCFGFVALCVVAYFLWIAILYAGIPLAIIGGGIAVYLYRHQPDDGDRDTRTGVVIVLAGCSMLLGITSIAGNIFSDSGPFGHHTPRASEDQVAEDASSENTKSKVSVTPEQCARLRTEPQTREMVSAMCYRMYSSNSWGDAASRAMCEGEQKDRMDACGVEFLPSD